jgi:hypothetical protein
LSKKKRIENEKAQAWLGRDSFASRSIVSRGFWASNGSARSHVTEPGPRHRGHRHPQPQTSRASPHHSPQSAQPLNPPPRHPPHSPQSVSFCLVASPPWSAFLQPSHYPPDSTCSHSTTTAHPPSSFADARVPPSGQLANLFALLIYAVLEPAMQYS